VNRYSKIWSRILNGETIFIDGATGTEIERRGVPQLDNAWNGGGALSNPDILLEVHEDYIRSGVDIVISNTFATLKSALVDAGLEQQFESLNQRSIELACTARANLAAENVVVAGGISHWSWSGRYPTLKHLCQNATQQAQILRESGAELIMLEMMSKMERMLAVLEGVEQVDLPVWVGLSCKTGKDRSPRLYDSNEALEDAINVLHGKKVDLLSIMHTDVSLIDECLDVVQANWDGPIGVYAHSGDYIDGKWIFDNVISPNNYAEIAKGWHRRGVRAIGGCCGIGPNHIDVLIQKIRTS